LALPGLARELLADDLALVAVALDGGPVVLARGGRLDAGLAVPAGAGQAALEAVDLELAVALGDDLGAELAALGDLAGVLSPDLKVRPRLLGVGERVGGLLLLGPARGAEQQRRRQGGHARQPTPHGAPPRIQPRRAGPRVPHAPPYRRRTQDKVR